MAYSATARIKLSTQQEFIYHTKPAMTAAFHYYTSTNVCYTRYQKAFMLLPSETQQQLWQRSVALSINECTPLMNVTAVCFTDIYDWQIDGELQPGPEYKKKKKTVSEIIIIKRRKSKEKKNTDSTDCKKSFFFFTSYTLLPEQSWVLNCTILFLQVLSLSFKKIWYNLKEKMIIP